MLVLILGVVVLIGAHSVSSLPNARAKLVARYGVTSFRIAHSLLSLVGLALVVRGFSRYREAGLIPIWAPPLWERPLTISLMAFAFVALASAFTGQSRIRGWLVRPARVATMLWAVAHLLANGDLGGIILFGGFLAWGVLDAALRAGEPGPPKLATFRRGDAMAVAAGLGGWVAMIAAHPYLIGLTVLDF